MSRHRCARGQAATELLVALLVCVPLFTGLLALAGLLDLQAALHRASGATAFRLALAQPRGTAPGQAERDAARDLLFASEADRGAAPRDAGQPRGTPTAWRDAAGAPLLADGAAATVDLASTAPAAAWERGIGVMASGLGLPAPRQDRISIGVHVTLGAGAGPLQGFDPRLASTTALAGTGWAARGPVEVRDRVGRVAVGGLAGEMSRVLEPLGDLLIGLLEDTPAPRLGCVQPEAVPADRLSRPVALPPCSR